MTDPVNPPAEPLLRTKMFIPSGRAKKVARPELVGYLNAHQGKKLVLVSAPAGFGKTTLLADWARQVHAPVAWLSLDEGDNDPYRLLAYLDATLDYALKQQVGEPGGLISGLLGSVQPAPIQTILVALVNSLTDLAQTVFIILDDYQFIGNPVVDEAVAFFLEHLPPCAHLLIASRVDPRLPLHRLRARQQLAELRMEDLRFAPGETGAFLNEVMELALTGEQIAALERRTEGWIVGLQMAALSLQGSADRSAFIEAFSGSHRYVLEYLIEEVLNRQPEEIKAFLLHTSILDRLSASLCSRVTGLENCQAILEHLERANIFLIALDEERHWYRYHHLFAELLQARLQLQQPAILAGLHGGASQWYEQNDFPELAIQHALAAGDPDRAGRLVEANAISILSRGEMSIMLRLFENLPQELVISRPRLCVLHAWALTFSGQFARSEARLLDAERQITQSDIGLDRQAIQGGIALNRAVIADFRGDIAAAVELAHLADSLLAQDDLAERSIVPYILGDGYFASGELDQAADAYHQIRRIGQLSGNLWTIAVAIHKLVLVKKVQGKLNEVEELYTAALQLASEKKGQQYGSLGAVLTGIADLHRERNQLDQAMEMVDRALKNMEHWPNPTDLLNAYCTQAQIYLALGQSDEAGAVLREAEDVSQSKGVFPVTRQALDASLVKYWISSGQIATVRHWMEEKLSSVIEPPVPPAIHYLNELEWITLARALIALQQTGTALEILQAVRDSAEAGGRYGRMMEALPLLALALRQTGHIEDAIEIILTSLDRAAEEGYRAIYLDEGLPMAELLQAGRGRAMNRTKVTIDQLLNAFSKPETAAARQIQTDSLVEPLTRRELEILSLLAAGLTNREIALRLFLSEGTIKTHTHNLYGKLGVQNRTKAIACARELKLI